MGTFNQAAGALSFSINGLGAGFTNKLTFSLGTNLGIDGGFTWTDRASSTISDFSAQMFRSGAPGLPDFLVIGSVSPVANQTSFGPHYPADLAAGNYYLLISGNGGGGTGGRYTATLNSFLPIAASIGPAVSPVPEPGTWAMMIAGLMLISMRVRRSNQRLATSAECAVVVHGRRSGRVS